MQLMWVSAVAVHVATSSLMFTQGPVPMLSAEASAAAAAGIARAAALGEHARTCSDLKLAAQTRLDAVRTTLLEVGKSTMDLDRQLRDARERSRLAKTSAERATPEADVRALTDRLGAVEDRERQLANEEKDISKTELPKHQSCIDEALKNLKAMGAAPAAKS